MFRYYAWLAWRGLRRAPAMTALMVIAIGIGIGASVTTMTVLRLLSGDPLPGRSQSLFYPQIDPQDLVGFQKGEEPPGQFTYVDAMNLLHAKRADRLAVMSGGGTVVFPDRSGIEPFYVDGRYTTTDLFAMFGLQFLQGSAWTEADDEAHARVAVITRDLNNKLFDGDNSVGKMLRTPDGDFRIVGVVEDWRPTPHFYDMTTGRYDSYESLFVPLQTAVELGMDRNGNMNCFGDRPGQDAKQQLASDNCMWLQVWAELDHDSSQKDFENYLRQYSLEQKQVGRFQRDPNVRLRSLMQWLDYQHVVPDDVRLQVWVSLGFLLVCIVNTIGLMLAKFLRRSNEVAVRRALGAPRRSVFVQFLIEAGGIGVAGAVLGLVLVFAGLLGIRKMPVPYAALAHLDATMFMAAVAMAIVAALLAGLLPAWQAGRTAPALQLKSD